MTKEEDFKDGNGRPKPKSGYRCKICGKEGGQEDSHWYQLCPMKGKSDERTFNPPKKGYVCKFCHKQGGEPDSHWFQQCPSRKFFSGVQVPHPLAVGGNQQMFNMTVATQAMAMLPTTPQTQVQYTRQISATGMNVYLYPQYEAPVNQQHLIAMQQYAQQQQQQQQFMIQQHQAAAQSNFNHQDINQTNRQKSISMNYLSSEQSTHQNNLSNSSSAIIEPAIDQESVLNFIDSRQGQS